MNHAHQTASHLGARMSRPGLARRFTTALKQFIWSSDELPDLFDKPSASALPEWVVTSTLNQTTTFGILSTQPVFQITARTESEALCLASEQIRETYPGYVIVTLTAGRAP